MTVNTPALDGEPQAGRTPVKDAYQTHEQYWSPHSEDFSIPVDPFKIATELGIKVATAALGEKEDGSLEYTASGPVIFVNEAHYPSRQRFTCAHEIGHYIDQKNRGIEKPSYRDKNASTGREPEEIYANRFAAALLMPKFLVEKFHASGMDILEMARKFKVSEASMRWRLVNLSLVNS